MDSPAEQERGSWLAAASTSIAHSTKVLLLEYIWTAHVRSATQRVVPSYAAGSGVEQRLKRPVERASAAEQVHGACTIINLGVISVA